MSSRFSKLASLYSRLEDTPSYNSRRKKLSEFFSSRSPPDVKVAAYLTLGSIGASYEDTELGIAEKMAVRAVADAYGSGEKKVKKLLEKRGDLGDAAALLNEKKRSTLTISDVRSKLIKIKKASGEDSQKKKMELLSSLLQDAPSNESRFIVRIALGNLRIGVGEQMLLDAFAEAFAGGSSHKSEVEDGYNKCTDIGLLGESLAKHGLSSAKRFSITLGRPVRAMLAQRVDKVSDILEKIQSDELAVEEKYDGERVQVHKDGNRIILFSRHLNDITSQFPDIAEALKKSIKRKKAVLDGEIVGYRKGDFLSFQKLMQRRRKYDVSEYSEKVPAAVFLFDMIYLNGNSLLKKPYPSRRKALEKSVNESGMVHIAKRNVSSDFEKIREFFQKSVDKGLEGIIVKSTAKDSVYQPGNRGWLWIKWKKEYSEGMRETFDLAVVGSYHGRGSRAGHFGALLCAAFNPKKDRFETFTKVGTGFTDESFSSLQKLLKKHRARKKPESVVVENDMEPDVYYEPGLVIEVFGAEITRSPSHTAFRKKGKGLALRFPRFQRVRRDKGPEDATTIMEIKRIKDGK
ncbi:ATP-dependent DNA ligase [Candidatus Micrarchaeota archaeon]|nr:ATP-dependent DNA ligase [Candidatus Micrarchaeota archaeon]